jgi:lysophospholipase L1-like esterase
MAKLANNIPMILVLQPEITGKLKSLTTDEENILQALGNDYRDRAIASYQLANQSLNGKLGATKFLNFYQLFQDSKQQAFIDPIHLTEVANDLVAKRLYDNLEQLFLVQPAPNPLNPEAVPPQRPLS